MCKLALITAINDQNRKQAITLSRKIASIIAETQTNGMGLCLVDSSGQRLVEKWTKVNEALKKRKIIEEKTIHYIPKNEEKLNKYSDFIEYEPQVFHQVPSYSIEGNGQWNNAASIMIHGRIATTGEKTLKNTHPFSHNGSILMHNGIINNHTSFKKYVSECDSEALLTTYNESEVNIFPENIQNAIKDITGYYAAFVSSNDALNNPIIDIYKYNASLYLTELDNGLVFISTSETDIKKALKELKLKSTRTFKVNDKIMLRLNALTGEIILKQKFSPNVSTSYSTSSGYHSTGYNYNNDDRWDNYEYYNPDKTESKYDASLAEMKAFFGMDTKEFMDWIDEYKAKFGSSWKDQMINDYEYEKFMLNNNTKVG